jgi:hypothetical protein
MVGEECVACVYVKGCRFGVVWIDVVVMVRERKGFLCLLLSLKNSQSSDGDCLERICQAASMTAGSGSLEALSPT